MKNRLNVFLMAFCFFVTGLAHADGNYRTDRLLTGRLFPSFGEFTYSVQKVQALSPYRILITDRNGVNGPNVVYQYVFEFYDIQTNGDVIFKFRTDGIFGRSQIQTMNCGQEHLADDGTSVEFSRCKFNVKFTDSYDGVLHHKGFQMTVKYDPAMVMSSQ
jgi:hypothetical protein